MNKEQSADDPSVDLIRGKDAIAPFYELPDVVIACIEHKVSLEALEQLRQRW